MNILVVDDDNVQLMIYEDILSQTKHHVKYFADARLALTYFETENQDYQLIISDILMPEMDGLELIRKLKNIVPGLKIIAVSAGGQIGSNFYLTMARDFGASVILEKPVDVEKLLSAITSLSEGE